MRGPVRQRGELFRNLFAACREPKRAEHMIGPVFVLTFQRYAQLRAGRQFHGIRQKKRGRLRLADSTLDGPAAFAVNLRIAAGLQRLGDWPVVLLERGAGVGKL